MIIRTFGDCTRSLCKERSESAAVGDVGRIEVLKFTSGELEEIFGITLREFEVGTPFELAAALADANGRPTDVKLRNNRLVRLLSQRVDLLPCFVAYQRVSGIGTVPFATDAVAGKWSLFFARDGRMTLVERDRDRFMFSDAEDLLLQHQEGRQGTATVRDRLRSTKRLFQWRKSKPVSAQRKAD